MERDNSAKNSALQQTSAPPAAPVRDEQTAAEQKPEQHYKPFTKADAEQIDLPRLLSDVLYQMDFAADYGMDALSVLMEKARRQEAESPKEPEPQETYSDLGGSGNGGQQEIQEKGLYRNTERQKEIEEEWRQLCNKAIEGNSY